MNFQKLFDKTLSDISQQTGCSTEEAELVEWTLFRAFTRDKVSGESLYVRMENILLLIKEIAALSATNKEPIMDSMTTVLKRHGLSVEEDKLTFQIAKS